MVRLFQNYAVQNRGSRSAPRQFLSIILASIALNIAFAPVSGAAPTPPQIVVHYMPWFAAKPYSSVWGWHWTMNAGGPDGPFNPDQMEADGRRHIASHLYPQIGPYDSADPAVVEYHLQLMKIAGLDGIIVDWHGVSDLYDYATIRDTVLKLLPRAAAYGLKVGICYEDQTINQRVAAGKLNASSRVDAARQDISWIKKTVFAADCALRVGGNPLLLSFGQNGLTDAEWSSVLQGETVGYYSEHNRRSAAVGAFDWPLPEIGPTSTQRFYAQNGADSHFIAAAFTRFDDVYAEGKAGKSFPKIDDEKGALLKRTLMQALNSRADLVQIATWNDWGEGTEIEPSREVGSRDLQTVQSLSTAASKAGWKPEDLQIPLRLYNLKRFHKAAPQELAALYKKIAGGIAESNVSLVRSAIAEAERVATAPPQRAVN
jgi:Glycosyl hydrolase family 99/Glycosyltransferase WbsX